MTTTAHPRPKTITLPTATLATLMAQAAGTTLSTADKAALLTLVSKESSPLLRRGARSGPKAQNPRRKSSPLPEDEWQDIHYAPALQLYSEAMWLACTPIEGYPQLALTASGTLVVVSSPLDTVQYLAQYLVKRPSDLLDCHPLLYWQVQVALYQRRLSLAHVVSYDPRRSTAQLSILAIEPDPTHQLAIRLRERLAVRYLAEVMREIGG